MQLDKQALAHQIQHLAGVDPLTEYDESFFQPIGSDHLAQFFFNTFSPDLGDLDLQDQREFLVNELTESLNLELSLVENTPYATCKLLNKTGANETQAVFDFTDPLLTFVHFFGHSKGLVTLANRLGQTSLFQLVKLPFKLLWSTQFLLDRLTEVQTHFEQSGKIFPAPDGLKATLRGKESGLLLQKLSTLSPHQVNLEAIEGSTSGLFDSKVRFTKSGRITASGVKLGAFLGLCDALIGPLKRRYQALLNLHCPQLNLQERWFQLSGQPVRYQFPTELPLVEPLIKELCQGPKGVHCFGNFDRLSPELWQACLFNPQGGKLRIELSKKHLSVYLTDSVSVVLFDQLESFLESQVFAQLRSTLAES